MGSLLSPIVADLALQYLELHILKKLSFTPSFYIRYVDDIAFPPMGCRLVVVGGFRSRNPQGSEMAGAS